MDKQHSFGVRRFRFIDYLGEGVDGAAVLADLRAAIQHHIALSQYSSNHPYGHRSDRNHITLVKTLTGAGGDLLNLDGLLWNVLYQQYIADINILSRSPTHKTDHIEFNRIRSGYAEPIRLSQATPDTMNDLFTVLTNVSTEATLSVNLVGFELQFDIAPGDLAIIPSGPMHSCAISHYDQADVDYLISTIKYLGE